MSVVLSSQDLRRLAAMFAASLDLSRHTTLEAWQHDVERRLGELLGPHSSNGWSDLSVPAMQADESDDVAALLNGPDAGGVAVQGNREVALLSLVVPVLRAAHRAQLASAEGREQLLGLIDRMKTASALYDLRGRREHVNPALRRLLAVDPGADLIRNSIDALASVAAIARAGREPGGTTQTPGLLSRELRTARATYDLRATSLGPGGTGTQEGVILVGIEERPRPALSLERLQRRHGLTRREAEVARLLALGRRTTEIADSLGVSTHTARHHAQAVLNKLGIHSRAAVAAAIQPLESGLPMHASP